MPCAPDCIPEKVKWAIAFFFIAVSTPVLWRLYQVAHGGGCYYDNEHVLQCSAPIPLKFVDFDGDGEGKKSEDGVGETGNKGGEPPEPSIGGAVRDAYKQAKILIAQDNKAARLQYCYTVDKWFIITGLTAAIVICSGIYIIGELAGRTCGNVSNCLWYLLSCRCCWPKPKEVKQYRDTVYDPSSGTEYSQDYSWDDDDAHRPRVPKRRHQGHTGSRRADSRRHTRRK